MRYKSEQKEHTRKKIIVAAEHSFKKHGYCGIGVDGLAKEAGVTSGAFYGHFKSKQDVFQESVASGLDDAANAISELKKDFSEDWWKEFAKLYTSERRTCDLTESCAMQTLTSEVGRSDEVIKKLYQSKILNIVKLASNGTDQKEQEKTWVKLAMLIGGVTLARAMSDDKLSKKIATAINNQFN